MDEDLKKRMSAAQLRVMEVLAYALTAALIGMIYILMFKSVEQSSREILLTLTGSLVTGWMIVIGYIYGSSAGSHTKDLTTTNPENKP